MHNKNIVIAGKKLADAKRALIMLHGRGATAEDILGLSDYLNVKDYALLAPQATTYTWYPLSFLAPVQQNEPWLTSAIELVSSVVNDVEAAGIKSENIFFLGFSQGACLTLEYVTRHAKKWGGVAAFTGGLIGDKINTDNYKGDFGNTPVFIGTSDPDPHVPVIRVKESVKILQSMNASVTEMIYKNMGHTVSEDEINQVNKLIFK